MSVTYGLRGIKDARYKSNMKRKINTARAWGYLCEDSHGKYTQLAEYASHRKCWANPSVRVRIMREKDYRALVRAGKRE
jgi:hypothetical protein